MKCYYDVLGVDMKATNDIIKRAYYKQSLKWHPDKNIDNAAEATEMFQEIQRAYKVLSNEQERAWYDKNRERFMSMSFNPEEQLYDLINNIVYQGFGDDENGFYAVYQDIFDKLIEREQESCRLRSEYLGDTPVFGNSSSDYKKVVSPFYSHWESFQTKLSFHWKNKHEINLSYPRDIRRAMEKENFEERYTAKKEYNKAIQSLITNLKTRDPRIKLWKEHLINKEKDDKKKAISMAQKAWEKSHQNMTSFNPNYGGISVEELEEKLNSLEIEHGKTGNLPNTEAEDFYCVACNKYFRSLAAFNNHEKSKNHHKNLVALRKQIMMEDNELFSDLINDISHEKISLEIETTDSVIENIETEKKYSDINEEILQSEETTVNTDNNEIQFVNDVIENVEETSDVTNNDKLGKKRRRKPKSEKTISENPTKPIDMNNEDSLACEQCGNHFPSRNKLFQHVKSSGHGTIKSTTNSNKSRTSAKSKLKK